MAPLLNVSEVVARFLKTRQPHGEKEFYTWAEAEKIPAVIQDNCWKAIAEQPEKFELKDCLPIDAEFFLDQFGASVCCWQRQVRHVKSAEFRRWAIGWLDAHGKFSQATLSALTDLADANASLSQKTHDLHVRCVEDNDGNLWLDLCNDNWEAVKIMPGKWEVVSAPPSLFRRYPHMRPIVIADEGNRQDFDDFLAILHLKSEADEKLIAGVLGTAWVAGIPHPIVISHGGKGAGKTTLCEHVRHVIDPSELLTMSLSRDEQQMAQKLMHHYCAVFDNAHELSQLQSDMLCRACTGEGFSKRQLYTDDGDVVFKYRRIAFLNGLNIPGSQPDLLDRAILLELERIPKTARKRKAVLDKRLRELAPKVRRYMLDTLAKALHLLPSIPDNIHPRMADFAYYAEAFLRAMGYPEGTFFAVYDKNIQQQTEEAILGSMVGELVLAFMSDRSEWEGCAEALLSALSSLAEEKKTNIHDKAFPKRGNALTRKLNILASDLEEMGIKYENSKSGGARKIWLHRILSDISSPENNTVQYIVQKSHDVVDDMGDKDDILQHSSTLSEPDQCTKTSSLQNTVQTVQSSQYDVKNMGGTCGDIGKSSKAMSSTNQTKVRFLKSTPVWRGADKQEYGSFKAGETRELPAAEAAWAIKNGLAQPMDGD